MVGQMQIKQTNSRGGDVDHDRRWLRGLVGPEPAVGAEVRPNAPGDLRPSRRRDSANSIAGIRSPRSITCRVQIQELDPLYRHERGTHVFSDRSAERLVG